MSAPERRPLRVVLDTNVAVAALLWSGPPREVLRRAHAGTTVDLFSSARLIDELGRTLARAKFAPRLQAVGTSAEHVVAAYTDLVRLVVPTAVPRVVAADADDDHVIAAALAARADVLVTGDRRHLLPIGTYREVRIVDPRQMLDLLGQHGEEPKT